MKQIYYFFKGLLKITYNIFVFWILMLLFIAGIFITCPILFALLLFDAINYCLRLGGGKDMVDTIGACNKLIDIYHNCLMWIENKLFWKWEN